MGRRILTAALVGCLTLTFATANDDGVLRVTLKPLAQPRDGKVTIADVADLEGGTDELRGRVAALDVAELDGPEGATTLTATAVAFRLQLAGIARSEFEVAGAPLVAVRRAAALIGEADVVAAARHVLLAKLPWPADKVAVRQAQPVRLPLLPHGADLRLEPDLPPHASLAGRVRLDVTVFRGRERCAIVPVHFEVRPLLAVAVATRRIERGEFLREDNVQSDLRPSDGADTMAPFSEVVAPARARRTILPGQVVTRTDLEATSGDGAVLVRPYDRVNLVAVVGPVRITARGEALQEGRAGQRVRVRNVDSKAVVSGKVVDKGVVEVEK